MLSSLLYRLTLFIAVDREGTKPKRKRRTFVRMCFSTVGLFSGLCCAAGAVCSDGPQGTVQ